nr:hypothetical protein [Tanacetum cinerariifolium]
RNIRTSETKRLRRSQSDTATSELRQSFKDCGSETVRLRQCSPTLRQRSQTHWERRNSWMAFGRNTRDLGSFGEETDEITTLHQTQRRKGHTDPGDGVTTSCDGVRMSK